MQAYSEIVLACCAVATLIIYWTASTVGAVIFIFRKIDSVRDTILADVNTKHKENTERVNAMQALVIRHDTILNPEFNGHFGSKHVR